MNDRLVPGMVARGRGRVISTVSGVATKPQTGTPSYSASKMANLNLAISLAHALAGTGVTSDAVSPGIIMTEGVDIMFDQMGIAPDPAEWAKVALEFAPNPAGRPGRPEEIAEAVVFLASRRAEFMTGRNLRVDRAMCRR